MPKIDKDFLAGVAALAETLRRNIDADMDGWSLDAADVGMRKRAVQDEHTGFAYFHRTYFRHYGTAEPSELHTYLHKRLSDIIRTKADQRDAIAAPRGEAKSTVVSLVFVLWCVVTQAKHYPIIIMDAFEQAAEMLEAIKAELGDKDPGMHRRPGLHETRSLSARTYVAQGMDPKAVQTLLGHSDIEMTEMYLNDRGLSRHEWKRVAVVTEEADA